MATTYNFTNGSISGQMVPHTHTPNEDGLFVLWNIIDCSRQTLDAGEGDIGQAIIIPAGTTVMACYIRVITAETANGTVDLGYGGSNQWGDALAVDSAAGTILGATHDWVPIHFATADTVDVTATTDTADVDIDGAKLEVVAICRKALDAA